VVVSLPRTAMAEVHITALNETVANSEAMGEQRRQKAEAARRQIADMTAKFAILSKQVAKHSMASDEQRAELDKLQAKMNACWEREATAVFFFSIAPANA
jgi:uncharacterized coiled-coil protein SlyX